MKIEGQIVDVHSRSIFKGNLVVRGKYIESVNIANNSPGVFILPGLIDSHIHIESSMATPGSFAVEAVSRGTTGVISDPHEIANVLGMKGVRYMIEDGEGVPLKFWFGAPSCVPATSFESNGAMIDSHGVEKLLDLPEIKYLAEMMNFPGVISGDIEVKRKISAAINRKLPIDGHAPGLKGEDLKKYISAGITTDHECSTIREAEEKIALGMKVLIREGSAARNLDALKALFTTHPEMIMLCSDDMHPEMLVKRHINIVVAQLIREGYDLFDVIRSCSVNPIEHYGLEAGTLQKGELADFIIVKDLKEMDILETWIEGRRVFHNGKVQFRYKEPHVLNKFCCSPIKHEDIRVVARGNKLRVMEAYDGELITKEFLSDISDKKLVDSDTKSDILKIVVKDRYKDLRPATAFIKGFGLKTGAFAGSVAHDSHNIISIGTDDNDIVAAINEIVRIKGGLAVSVSGKVISLRLPVAGIMSTEPVRSLAQKYEDLSNQVKNLGCKMKAPFMTLSFMALLVIPELKLSDRGLFNGIVFRHVPLFPD